MTSHLLSSHPLLFPLLPLKAGTFNPAAKRGRIVWLPPSSPTPVTVWAHKKAAVMGRLPPFICRAHCSAYCEAVISVKNKFVGANKAASCGATKHNKEQRDQMQILLHERYGRVCLTVCVQKSLPFWSLAPPAACYFWVSFNITIFTGQDVSTHQIP